MSRELGWPERHSFGPASLRALADAMEILDREVPLMGMEWTVDVSAPEKVWQMYDGEIRLGKPPITPSDVSVPTDPLGFGVVL